MLPFVNYSHGYAGSDGLDQIQPINHYGGMLILGIGREALKRHQPQRLRYFLADRDERPCELDMI